MYDKSVLGYLFTHERESKQNKGNKGKNMKTITIAATEQENDEGKYQVPFVRLRGKWLNAIGLYVGARATVEVVEGKIIITPE